MKDVDKYIDESLHSNDNSKASTAQREAIDKNDDKSINPKATTYTAIAQRNDVKDKFQAATTAQVDIERIDLDDKTQAVSASVVTKRNDNKKEKTYRAKFYVHDEICLTPKF